MIRSIIATYRFCQPHNLIQFRFLITCLLGFSGFLRISELLEIHVGDMTFDNECMKILIPKSKNDQVREGHIVYISRMNSDYCTVHWVQQFLEVTNLGEEPTSFIMCRFAKTKKGHNTIGHRQISYTTVYMIFTVSYHRCVKTRVLESVGCIPLGRVAPLPL